MTHARTAAAWFFIVTGFACLGLFGLHVARVTAPNPHYEAEQALRHLQHTSKWGQFGPSN